MPSLSSAEQPLITVDDLLWFLYLYPLRILSAIAPRSFLYSLGRLSRLRGRKRMDMAMRRMLNVQCARIPSDRIPQIADSLLANSADRMLDDLVVSWPSSQGRLRCTEIQGLEHLEQARAAGNGVLLLTVHFCATRVARRHLATIGYPILTVRDHIAPGDWWGRLGRRILAPRRVKFLRAIIGESVYTRDPACALKIFNRLRSGGLVSTHFDGESGTRTVPWSFLGSSRRFSTGVLDVVRLSGCAVVPMLCLGRSSGFRIVFGPVLDIFRAPGRDEFIQANIGAFVHAIEQQIVDHPEEWEPWMVV